MFSKLLFQDLISVLIYALLLCDRVGEQKKTNQQQQQPHSRAMKLRTVLLLATLVAAAHALALGSDDGSNDIDAHVSAAAFVTS